MKETMKPVVYMPDTNILWQWASTFVQDIKCLEKRQQEAALRIKSFCEENRHPIVVPDLVWVEFLSVMLHKDIDVEKDYADTLLKFRHMQSLIQQMEVRIRAADNWTLDWEPDTSPFPDAAELLQAPDLIDRKTFEWMQKSANNRKKYRPDMKHLTAKILDGMDSAILVCLNELASQEENKERTVVLYTADLPLCRILARIKILHHKWFAQNTAAVFALSENVMCHYRHKNGTICRGLNPSRILVKNEMVCAKGRGKGKHFLEL